MRIGIVCPYNFFRPGGVQSHIKNVADELQRRGHYVKIIAPKPRIVPKKIPKEILLIGNSAEFNTPFSTKGDLGLSISNKNIDKILNEQKFDILHFHEPGVPVFSAQLIARSKSINVATMHAMLPEGVMSKSIEKLIQPYAKLIEPNLHYLTAVSEPARQGALSLSAKNKIEIVPNGINLNEYSLGQKSIASQKASTKKKTILYVGRLEKRKGVRYLINAYKELSINHKNIELLIAGDGGLRQSLEMLVEKIEAPNVKFLGFISEKRKIKLLQTVDLFVSPAIYGESFGIVLLEALATGCVTVAGNNPGYQSVMTGRGKISLISPKDTLEFSQRMELLLFDNEIRDLWLKWAKKHVKQFDYKIITDKYEAIYNKAMKKYKG